MRYNKLLKIRFKIHCYLENSKAPNISNKTLYSGHAYLKWNTKHKQKGTNDKIDTWRGESTSSWRESPKPVTFPCQF